MQAQELRTRIREIEAQKAAEIERKKQEQLVAIAAQFGGTEAILQQQEIRLDLLAQAREKELLTEQQFLAAKQQLELDFLKVENENKVLLEQDFQNQKLLIEQEASERRIDSIISAEQRLNDVQGDLRINKLQQEQDILQRIVAAENTSVEDRIVAQKRLAKTQKTIQRERLQIASQGFGELASLTSSSNKTLFAIGKASAVAQASISGFLSIQNALAIQPFFPLGLLLAAGAVARFATNIGNIKGTNLQTGGQIPGGFPNDSFRANLTSGERVLNVQENRDFTESLKRDSEEDQILSAIKDQLVENNGIQRAILDTLGNLETENVVNIGSKEVFREIRSGLREGRTLAV